MTKGRLLWLALLSAFTGTLVATSLLWIFLIDPVRQAVKTGNEIQAQFVKFLNLTPRIEANHAVIFTQSAPALEFVTATQTALVRSRSDETWLHSTKIFEVEAPFTARAGFNLRDPFSVNIQRGGKIAEVRLPHPKILSCEMGEIQITRDEDGLWNKITAKDREKAFRDLSRAAKEEFLKTDILRTATEEAEKQIREIAAAAGCKAVFIYEGPPAP